MADDDSDRAALHARLDRLLWWAGTNREMAVLIRRRARAARLASERARRETGRRTSGGRPDPSSRHT